MLTCCDFGSGSMVVGSGGGRDAAVGITAGFGPAMMILLLLGRGLAKLCRGTEIRVVGSVVVKAVIVDRRVSLDARFRTRHPWVVMACDCAAVAASVGALDGGFGLIALRGGAGVARGSILILSGRCYVQDTFVMCE